MTASRTLGLAILSIATFAGAMFASPLLAGAATPSTSGACSFDIERFGLAAGLTSEWRQSYRAFVDRTHSPMRGFADAWTLRRLGLGKPDQQLVAEFWMSQAFLRAGLPHLAHAGWNTMLARPLESTPSAITLPLLATVAQCMTEIRSKTPTLVPTLETLPTLMWIASQAKKPGAAPAEPAADLILALILSPHTELSREQEAEAFGSLKGIGGYDALAQGLYAAKRRRHSEAIPALKQVLFSSSLVTRLKEYLPRVRLVLARSYYATHQYSLAIEQLKALPKQTPDVNEVLTELAWAQLQDLRYREAIGTALNLQTGGLAKAYAPEGPMILAMALNELCQYPSAVQAVNSYRSRYKQTYFWLRQWEAQSASGASGLKAPSLYDMATHFRRDDATRVPPRIAAEWIKHPGFLARQMEINQLIDTQEAIDSMTALAAKEQRALSDALLVQLTALQKEVALSRLRLPASSNVSSSFKLPEKVQKLSDSALQTARLYRRYRFAAPLWTTVTGHFRQQATTIRTRLVASIERELQALNRRMLTQMTEIADNTQLIEIEIYNGASQDIIWKQAHPDYAELAQELRAEDAQTQASAIWNWGRAQGDLNEDGEYWEDELGTFKADLVDNCASKDKYMQLKRRLASE